MTAEMIGRSMLLDTIERCYFGFRRRRDVQQARPSECNACVQIPDPGPHPLRSSRVLATPFHASRWVSAHQQVLITGPTGVGKTYLACALAGAAIRAGHSALYARVPRLLTELATARLDGRLPRLLAAWARIDVLVLDDFALQPLTDA